MKKEIKKLLALALAVSVAVINPVSTQKADAATQKTEATMQKVAVTKQKAQAASAYKDYVNDKIFVDTEYGYSSSFYNEKKQTINFAVFAEEAHDIRVEFDGASDYFYADSDWYYDSQEREYYTGFYVNNVSMGDIYYGIMSLDVDFDAYILIYADDEPTPSIKLKKPAVNKIESVGGELYFNLKSVDSKASFAEYKVYNKSGKKVASGTTYSSGVTVYSGVSKNQIYYVQARVGAYDSSVGKDVYSSWSAKKYTISQPLIKGEKSKNTMKVNAITLYWSKVTGATKYTVYCSNSKTTGYKKIGTTKKTSMKVTKFKGKKINFRTTKYFKVVSQGKVGKKKITSSKYGDVGFYVW